MILSENQGRCAPGLRGWAAAVVVIFLMVAAWRCPPVSPESSGGNTLSEVRGVWLTNVDSELLFSKQSIASGMDRLAAAGFNVVFPVVWNEGYTLYPSDVMETRFGAEYRIDPLFARQGRDPLAELVVEAHRVGLEVIPWFEFGFSSSYSQDGGHILARYPEWAAKDRYGRLLKKNGFEWMNGLHPDAQAFLIDLVVEVAARYDVDGVQGDDRLPAMPSEGGYDEYTAELYRSEFGVDPPADSKDSAWVQWRADKLSDFGGDLYRAVKAIDENLIVSMSPSVYPWSLQEYLQDWPEWMARGQVDAVHPQAYRYDVGQYRATVNDILRYGREADSTIVLAPGVLLKSGQKFNGPAYVREALRHDREIGLDGEVYFFYEGLFEQNEFVIDTLSTLFYREPASLPYRAPGEWVFPVFASSFADATVEGSWVARGDSLMTSSDSEARVSYQYDRVSAGTYRLMAEIPVGVDRTFTANVEWSGSSDGRVDFAAGVWRGWVDIERIDIQEGGSLAVVLRPDPSHERVEVNLMLLPVRRTGTLR
jgi:uncharacterized lipoprotein YddW (UPF0748 family)